MSYPATLRSPRYLPIYRWLILALVILGGVWGCARPEVEGPASPAGRPGTQTLAFDLPALAEAGAAGVTGGRVTFRRLEGSGVAVTLEVLGNRRAEAGYRYFGIIELGQASDPVSRGRLADLNEVEPATGRSETLLELDYLNRPLTWEVLLEKAGSVRIVELEPVTGRIITLVRGDVLGNAIQESPSRLITLEPRGTTGWSGQVQVRTRLSGRWVVDLQSQNGALGLPSRLSLYRGQPGRATLLRTLATFAPGQTRADIDPAAGDGIPAVSFETLDTLAGFLALETIDPLEPEPVLVAVAILAGSQPVGPSETILLFDATDSARRGELIVSSLPSGELIYAFRLPAGSPAGAVTHYLGLHTGTADSGMMAYRFVPVGLPGASVEPVNLPTLIRPDGRPLTPADWATGNLHLTLTADTALTAPIAVADIGGNALIGTALSRPLVAAVPQLPGYTGQVILQSRRSGALRVTISMDQTAFEEHVVELHRGPFDPASPPPAGGATLVRRLGLIEGTTGPATRRFALPASAGLTLAMLTSQPHHIQVLFSEIDDYAISYAALAP